MKKHLLSIVLLLALLGGLSFLLLKPSMKSFPKAVHAWSQADRYALALNFEGNGYTIFLPETYCLNPQFPPGKPLSVDEGITRVDFPVHDYIVSLLMHVFNSRDPFIFRAYVLAYSLLGLVFLFLLSARITRSRLKSFFIVLFTFTAPVFLYYQNGFLPTVPSLANLFIGLYFYANYRHTGKLLQLGVALLFFTLSALARTPFVIFPAAIFLYHILEYLRSKKWKIQELVMFLACFGMITGYFIYNIFLGRKYGSVFLSAPLPPANWNEFVYILNEMKRLWLPEYFTRWHYIALVLLATGASASMILKRNFRLAPSWLWQTLLIATAATSVYAFLMAGQFKAHDYYFLDTFFPIIILLTALLLAWMPSARHSKAGFLYVPVFVLFSAMFVFHARGVQQARYSGDVYNFIDAAAADFEGASVFLDSLGVPRDARLVVLNSYNYNIVPILAGRKSYSLFNAESGDFEAVLDKRWDYALVQEKMPVSDLISKDPLILSRLERLTGNGLFAVYRRTKLDIPQTIPEFLRMTEPVYHDTINFESDTGTGSPFAGFLCPDAPRSGSACACMGAGTEFMELLNIPAEKLNVSPAGRILVSGYIRLKTWNRQSGAELILTVSAPGGLKRYTPFKLGEYLDQTNEGWQFFAFQFSFVNAAAGDMVKVYFWNAGNNEFALDDIVLSASTP